MSASEQKLFVGIDLAWVNGRTGLAAVDAAGALVASATVSSDDEIAAWVESLPGTVVVAAVDAPLLVPNETGQRAAETAISRAYGTFKIGAHTANQGRPGMAEPRAKVLADRFGWSVAPTHRGSARWPVCIEVYPHPAMVALFALPERLTYKSKFPYDVRRAAFAELVGHLEGIAELALPGHAGWAALAGAVRDAGTQGDLNAVEDELDGVLCAHLAWLWHERPGTLQVYPSLPEWEDGYIVAPAPPVRPLPAPPSDELANYRDYLGEYRKTLARKCAGLAPADLARRSVPPSRLSLLGMVRHMARVEHFWFQMALQGRPGPRLHDDDGDAGFAQVEATQAAVDEADAAWREQVALADAWLDLQTDATLGEVVTFRDGTETASVRDILVHMIEEYARHCGHADLLRECIDGTTGE
ncbi:DUF429 domain-containing protein [Pimelobacter simplex]|uniref:DUF429 domain-containing protein n=1 Tax=Nocardioides simplex TaxID=2045 RepID=UPI003AACB909